MTRFSGVRTEPDVNVTCLAGYHTSKQVLCGDEAGRYPIQGVLLKFRAHNGDGKHARVGCGITGTAVRIEDVDDTRQCQLIVGQICLWSHLMSAILAHLGIYIRLP